MTNFIAFTSDYSYEGGQKVFISAPSRLNIWLKENPDMEVVSWKTENVGKEHSLCIVVEYKKRILVDHY